MRDVSLQEAGAVDTIPSEGNTGRPGQAETAENGSVTLAAVKAAAIIPERMFFTMNMGCCGQVLGA